jgi:CubicO group peptidase (beta-lactamase class C family)
MGRLWLWPFTALCMAACASANSRGSWDQTIMTAVQPLGVRRVAYAVVADGQVLAARGLDDAHSLASLTKPLAGLLALDLQARGRLRIDGDLERRLQQRADRADGGFFYDSVAFAAVGPLLAGAAGEPLPSAFAQLFARLGMPAARAPADVRATGGVVATARDLVALLRALDRGLLDATRLRPPYDLGWFVDDRYGTRLLWHYGQDDDASALLLWIPARHLGLVVLADGDGLSAPFYLLTGRVARSPLALAWLRRNQFSVDDCDQAMAEALARGARALRAAADRCPDQTRQPDPALVAAFARSGDARLRALAESMGRALLAADPDDPRVLFDVAVSELQAHEPEAARARLAHFMSLRLRDAPFLKSAVAELLAETR